jgi:hypothetical protein
MTRGLDPVIAEGTSLLTPRTCAAGSSVLFANENRPCHRRWLCRRSRRAKNRPQPRDIRPQRCRRPPRRATPPHLIRQPPGRHHPARLQHQQRQHRSLLWRIQRNLTAEPDCPDRTEQPHLEHPPTGRGRAIRQHPSMIHLRGSPPANGVPAAAHNQPRRCDQQAGLPCDRAAERYSPRSTPPARRRPWAAR